MSGPTEIVIVTETAAPVATRLGECTDLELEAIIEAAQAIRNSRGPVRDLGSL